MATSHSPHHHCHHGPQAGHRRATGLITNCGTVHHINHRGGRGQGRRAGQPHELHPQPRAWIMQAKAASNARNQAPARFILRALTLYGCSQKTPVIFSLHGPPPLLGSAATLNAPTVIVREQFRPNYMFATTRRTWHVRRRSLRCASGRSLPTPFQDRLCRLESHM